VERGKNPKFKNFTELSIAAKKFVPAVGSYEPNYKIVNMPYLRKRI
jgi:hypothetical protein